MVFIFIAYCLQCFDTGGWASGRACSLYKIWVMRCRTWLSVWSEREVQMICIWSN